MKSWCFLGCTTQAEILLEQAIKIIGIPKFICPASDAKGPYVTNITNIAKYYKIKVVNKKKAFRLLYNDEKIYGLVCRFDIIPESLITRHNRFLNLHNSLLPKWRGVHPLQWSILKGEKYIGITFHLCSRNVDMGDIVFQKRILLNINDTINDAYKKVIETTKIYVHKALENWINGKYIKQDSKRIPYATRLDKNIQIIDIKDDISVIHNKIRISQPPWPLANITLNNHNIKMLKSFYYPDLKKTVRHNQLYLDGYLLTFDSDISTKLFRLNFS